MKSNSFITKTKRVVYFVRRCVAFVFNRRRISTGFRFLRDNGLTNFFKVVVNKLSGRQASYGIDKAILVRENGYELFEKQQDEAARFDMLSKIEKFKYKPLISCILPAPGSSMKLLKKTIKSLERQTYANRELCRELDAAQGEFVIFLQPGGILMYDALFWIVSELNEHPDTDFLYTDEYGIYAGKRAKIEFRCKPNRSTELSQGFVNIGQLVVYRTSLLLKNDNPVEAAKNIRHIERILYYSGFSPDAAHTTVSDYNGVISSILASNDTSWFIKPGVTMVSGDWDRYLNVQKMHHLSEILPEHIQDKPASGLCLTESMTILHQAQFPCTVFIHTPQSPAARKPGCRDILFFMHCLDMFGAPIVLADMVRIVLENGDYPVILSTDDGPLKDVYSEMGITVLICRAFDKNHSVFENFIKDFDLAVVNTLICGRAVAFLDNCKIPVLWWLHEPSSFVPYYRHILPTGVSERVKVCAVSEYCKKSLQNAHLDYNYDILAYGIPDYAAHTEICGEPEPDVVTFLCIGGYSSVKGTDILLKALRVIDESLLENTQFILIGRFDNPKSRIDKQVIKAAAENRYIILRSILPRDQLPELYRKSDCVIVPSRQETVSAVVIEAAIFSKPAICSDEVGVAADHITPDIDGLFFPSCDHKALAAQIIYAIENREKIAEIGRNARKDLYEKHFTMDIYRENVLKAISETLQ